MTKIALMLVLPFLMNSAFAASPVARLKAACEKRLKDNSKHKAICECHQANLARKAKPAEIALLADRYEDVAGSEAKMEKEENRALDEFDTEVSENCIANQKWKLKK